MSAGRSLRRPTQKPVVFFPKPSALSPLLLTPCTPRQSPGAQKLHAPCNRLGVESPGKKGQRGAPMRVSHRKHIPCRPPPPPRSHRPPADTAARRYVPWWGAARDQNTRPPPTTTLSILTQQADARRAAGHPPARRGGPPDPTRACPRACICGRVRPPGPDRCAPRPARPPSARRSGCRSGGTHHRRHDADPDSGGGGGEFKKEGVFEGVADHACCNNTLTPPPPNPTHPHTAHFRATASSPAPASAPSPKSSRLCAPSRWLGCRSPPTRVN